MVTATVDDDKLAEYILQVPNSIRDEIREKTSTSADFREGAIEYYLQYSPQTTWKELAGELYYRECHKALAAARRFIKRKPGKCVYRIFSNRSPGFYFLPDSRDPASKRDRHLHRTGVYLCSPVLASGRMSARSEAQALLAIF
jgi:hypothetical protein